MKILFNIFLILIKNVYLCSVKVKKMLIMNFDFNTYRKHFNRMFKLTVDGKYKGLSILLSILGSRQFDHFVYKLSKLVAGRHGRYYIPVSDDVFTLKIAGHRLRVYAY